MSRIRVLVTDDSAFMRQVVTRALEDDGLAPAASDPFERNRFGETLTCRREPAPRLKLDA